jgi:hypothetical protein
MSSSLRVSSLHLDDARDNESPPSESLRRDKALDDALCSTFPASDPIPLNFGQSSLRTVTGLHPPVVTGN